MSLPETSLSCQQASSTFCSLKRMLGQKIVNMATMEQTTSDFYNIIKQTDVFVPDYSTKYYKISKMSSRIASPSTYVDRSVLYATGCCRKLQLLVLNVYIRYQGWLSFAEIRLRAINSPLFIQHNSQLLYILQLLGI